MRALSYLQPWPAAILLHKHIENRSWNVTARGPHLIHASKGFDNNGVLYVDTTLKRLGITPPHYSTVPRGAIVGRATIIDCVTIEDIESGRYPIPDDQRAWAFGPFCAILADIVACVPWPYKGALGFYEVPDSIVAQLQFAPTRATASPS